VYVAPAKSARSSVGVARAVSSKPVAFRSLALWYCPAASRSKRSSISFLYAEAWMKPAVSLDTIRFVVVLTGK
jgi:hypothetical protein